MDAKQKLITTSSTLTLSTRVALTNMNTPTIRTTNIEFHMWLILGPLYYQSNLERLRLCHLL
ncbi:MAG: hypothetical protein ACKPKO_51910 [Candidatus Fonsibacter sp.]